MQLLKFLRQLDPTVNDQIIGLINPAISLIFCSVFTALWLRARNELHVLAFAIGSFGFAFAMLVNHYTPDPNSWVSLSLSHLGLGTWGVAHSWGVCTRVGQSISIRLYVGIAVVAGMLVLATIPTNNEEARLYVTNGFVGLILALTAHSLARAAPRDLMDRLIVWLFALVAVQSYLRPMAVMIARGATPDVPYRESSFYTVFLAMVAVLTVLLGIVLCAAVAFDSVRKVQNEGGLDSLTGLRMRSKFEEDALELLDRASQQDVPVGLIVADIDLFKQVNDIFGHQAGDKVIATFGELCGNMIRSSDLSGRIGGEEFCLIAWHCDEATIQGLAERIRMAFAKTEHSGISGDIRVTASFGVASWRDGEGYGKLFARADAALYRAKREGRNRVVTDRCPPQVLERDKGTATKAEFADRRKLGNF